MIDNLHSKIFQERNCGKDGIMQCHLIEDLEKKALKKSVECRATLPIELSIKIVVPKDEIEGIASKVHSRYRPRDEILIYSI